MLARTAASRILSHALPLTRASANEWSTPQSSPSPPRFGFALPADFPAIWLVTQAVTSVFLWMGVLVQLSAGPEFKAFVGAPAATIVAHALGHGHDGPDVRTGMDSMKRQDVLQRILTVSRGHESRTDIDIPSFSKVLPLNVPECPAMSLYLRRRLGQR